MSKFEQFFASGKTMTVSFAIALTLFLIAFILGLMMGSFVFASILFAVLAVTLNVTYTKHSVNAMNTVIGAMMITVLIYAVQSTTNYITLNSVYSTDVVIGIVTGLCEIILIALIFIIHLSINMAHKSTLGRVKANQIMLIILFGINIVKLIPYFMLMETQLMYAITWVFQILALILFYAMIICSETKLNAYKLTREASIADDSWTDEKKAETKEKYFGK